MFKKKKKKKVITETGITCDAVQYEMRHQTTGDTSGGIKGCKLEKGSDRKTKVFKKKKRWNVEKGPLDMDGTKTLFSL